jgi:peroxiredoxin
MLPLGTPAPAFRLPDGSGRVFALEDAEPSRAYLIAFICNHCPYVKHLRGALAELHRDYAERGVAMFAISSNDFVEYPEDAPARMVEEARRNAWSFPYLVDEDQSVARAYDAACTPDFFLYDATRRLVYRGQFDDSRPDNGIPPTGRDLRAALEAALSGTPVPEPQRPSIGCNIKWKKGNEPEWFG